MGVGSPASPFGLLRLPVAFGEGGMADAEAAVAFGEGLP